MAHVDNLKPSARPRPLASVAFAIAALASGVVLLLVSEAVSTFVEAYLANGKLSSGAAVVTTTAGAAIRFGNTSADSTPSSATGPVASAAPPKTTAPSPPPTGTASGDGNCASPSWSSSNPEDTDAIGTQDLWWVNNDAWSGSHGPQSIYVCNQSSWYAISNQASNGGAVETYPDTEYDVGGRGNSNTKTIAQYNAITSTFSEDYPAAGSWDAAYDLWLNNWTTEIMIWNQWTGTQLYWPSDKSITVDLNGVPYWFQNNNGEFIFFRQQMVTSGSVDILAALKYLVAQNLIKSTDIPTQLEYGVEICSTTGNETFPMTGLTFTLN